MPFFERRSFYRLHILYILGWLPIAIYLLVAHFSWSYWYYVPEEELSLGLRLLLTLLPLLGEYLVALGSYSLFALLRDRGKKGAIGVAATLLLLFTIALFVLPQERYLYIGSFSDYFSQSATRLFSTTSSLLEWGAIGLWFTAVFAPLLYATLKERQVSQ